MKEKIDYYLTQISKKSGFRLIYIELYGHSKLWSFEMNLIDEEEINNMDFYTTLILGSNGSGKSFLLRAILDIFRQIHHQKLKPKNIGSYITGGYHIIYSINDEIFRISNMSFENPENGFRIVTPNKKLSISINNKPAKLEEVKLPSKLVASTLMLWDKFPLLKKDDPFIKHYSYLGIRNTERSAGTGHMITKTVENIVNNINGKQFIPRLSELLDFLGYDESMRISYVPKYRGLFWKKELSASEFTDMFENWGNHFKGRKNAPWGREYFMKQIKGRNQLITQLISFMKDIEFKKYGKGGRYIDFAIFNNSTISYTFPLIKHLRRLDLLSLPEIFFSKQHDQFGLANASSGEVQIITSLISLLATLEENSLILLDEPEVSLHPNWQMKYMHYLRTIFKQYPTCHFIICSHSHFLVSDLTAANSKIIGVDRKAFGDENAMKSKMIVKDISNQSLNTFGWSAEEVLYRIFEVRTTRNHYFEYDISKLASLLESKQLDLEKIKSMVEKLEPYKFNEKDPLKYLIDLAKEKYN